MLPKRKRITKEIFPDMMKNGKILSGSLFSLRYIPVHTRYGLIDKSIPGMDRAQFAFVAPKTVAKQAVMRNKLRRQGYNALSQSPIIPRIIGIFFYKKEAKGASFADIKADVHAILFKIRL